MRNFRHFALIAFALIACTIGFNANAINKADLVDCLRGEPPANVICPAAYANTHSIAVTDNVTDIGIALAFQALERAASTQTSAPAFVASTSTQVVSELAASKAKADMLKLVVAARADLGKVRVHLDRSFGQYQRTA